MIIQTAKELNAFIASVGTIAPTDIVALLAARKVIVSPTIARLLKDKAAQSITHITQIIKVYLTVPNWLNTSIKSGILSPR